MENINPGVPQSTAKLQIDDLINQFRTVFEDVLEALASLVFPDIVEKTLTKRDTVTISAGAFISWSNQFLSTLNAWVASSSFKSFACLFQSATVTFNVNAASKTALARLDTIVSLGKIRVNAAAAADPAAADALARDKAEIQSTITKLRGPFQCAPLTTSTPGPLPGSTITSIANSSLPSGIVSTIFTTKTIVVGATSTQVIIVCTKCAQTTGSGFTIITKTNGNVAITVTQPCVVTYVPDGTSTIHYGGTTKTVTEVCNKCIAPVIPPPAPIIYVTTRNGIAFTTTATAQPSTLPGPAAPASSSGTFVGMSVLPAVPQSGTSNPTVTSRSQSVSGIPTQLTTVAQGSGASFKITYCHILIAVVSTLVFLFHT